MGYSENITRHCWKITQKRVRLPGASWVTQEKDPACSAGDAGSPLGRKILEEADGGNSLSPPVFLPGKAHGKREPGGPVHGLAKRRT